MDITYSTRSKFLEACESTIREHRQDLDNGGIVHINLDEGGYDGRITITVNQDDQASFRTDWTSSDPTRFPARIKAAATALLNCGCDGTYEVSNVEGSLTIQAV